MGGGGGIFRGDIGKLGKKFGDEIGNVFEDVIEEPLTDVGREITAGRKEIFGGGDSPGLAQRITQPVANLGANLTSSPDVPEVPAGGGVTGAAGDLPVPELPEEPEVPLAEALDPNLETEAPQEEVRRRRRRGRSSTILTGSAGLTEEEEEGSVSRRRLLGS